MKMRYYTPIALLLFAGIGAAGCAESIDDAPEMHQSQEELVLFSIQDQASGDRAMNLVHTQERGWHISRTADTLESNLTGAENMSVRSTEQPLDVDFDINNDTGDDTDQDDTPGSAQAPPSRYNTTLAGTSQFSATVPGSYRFSPAIAGSPTHSPNTPASYGFSPSLSTGGQCSLEGICDFLATVCSFAPQTEGCGGGAIAQCRNSIRQVSAELPPEARPFVCALGNFFTCASNAIQSGGNPEAALDVCTQNLAGAGGIFGAAF